MKQRWAMMIFLFRELTVFDNVDKFENYMYACQICQNLANFDKM